MAKLTANDAAANDRFGSSVSMTDDMAIVGALNDGSLSGSTYVFSKDQGGANNWGQVTKLTANDAAAGDFFGYSVAVSDNVAIMGAYRDNNEGGSSYIFSKDQGGIDNWGQVTKFTGGNSVANDLFGFNLSVSGNVAIVGAYRDDDDGSNSGSAYIFSKDQGGANNWGQVAKLTANDAVSGDFFGYSVAVSGNMAIVGAREDDDDGSNSGSAYIFSKDQGGANNWGQVTKLTASDATSNDRFGWSTSISGDVALVGSSGDDDSGSSSGSAYIFSKDQGGIDNWGQVAKLNANDAAASDVFGQIVSVSGDVAIVGANQDDDNGSGSGSAYIFSKDQGGANNWGQVTKLTASDAASNDRFGWSTSISGNVAIVGANLDDDNGSGSGSAYIFSKDQGGIDNWGHVAKLTANDAAANDFFGQSVTVNGDVAIVGANQDDDNGSGSGSAYIFSKDQGGIDNWGQMTKLTAADGAAGDQFGYSVSLSGDVAILGAIQDDDGGNNSGSAYIFQECNSSIDDEPPSLTCPATVTINTDAGLCTASNVALGTPTVTDNCNMSITPTNDAPAIFPLDTTIVTWTADDGNGNSMTCEQLVIVSDSQAPAITCPATVTINTDAGICTSSNVTLGTPTVTDNCNMSITPSNDAPAIFPLDTTIVTWTADDGNGNSMTCEQLVIVSDNQAPTITCPATVTSVCS